VAASVLVEVKDLWLLSDTTKLVYKFVIVDCVTKDEVVDKYSAMCLPAVDGSQIIPAVTNVKSASSAKRTKYSLISALYL